MPVASLPAGSHGMNRRGRLGSPQGVVGSVDFCGPVGGLLLSASLLSESQAFDVDVPNND